MPYRISLILIVPAIIYLSGCAQCSGDLDGKVWCSGGGLSIVLVGFNPKQIDTIYTVQFTKGSNFTNVMDTNIYTSTISNEVGFIVGNPSSSNFGTWNYPIDASYDYEIIIPGLKTVKVSNINLLHQFTCDSYLNEHGLGYQCNVGSFEMNGSANVPVSGGIEILN